MARHRNPVPPYRLHKSGKAIIEVYAETGHRSAIMLPGPRRSSERSSAGFGILSRATDSAARNDGSLQRFRIADLVMVSPAANDRLAFPPGNPSMPWGL